MRSSALQIAVYFFASTGLLATTGCHSKPVAAAVRDAGILNLPGVGVTPERNDVQRVRGSDSLSQNTVVPNRLDEGSPLTPTADTTVPVEGGSPNSPTPTVVVPIPIVPTGDLGPSSVPPSDPRASTPIGGAPVPNPNLVIQPGQPANPVSPFTPNLPPPGTATDTPSGGQLATPPSPSTPSLSPPGTATGPFAPPAGGPRGTPSTATPAGAPSGGTPR